MTLILLLIVCIDVWWFCMFSWIDRIADNRFLVSSSSPSILLTAVLYSSIFFCFCIISLCLKAWSIFCLHVGQSSFASKKVIFFCSVSTFLRMERWYSVSLSCLSFIWLASVTSFKSSSTDLLISLIWFSREVFSSKDVLISFSYLAIRVLVLRFNCNI